MEANLVRDQPMSVSLVQVLDPGEMLINRRPLERVEEEVLPVAVLVFFPSQWILSRENQSLALTFFTLCQGRVASFVRISGVAFSTFAIGIRLDGLSLSFIVRIFVHFRRDTDCLKNRLVKY